jgi:thiamine biosynthesis protein ThiC
VAVETGGESITQLEMARSGRVTPEMETVAVQEELSPEYVRSGVADGAIGG